MFWRNAGFVFERYSVLAFVTRKTISKNGKEKKNNQHPTPPPVFKVETSTHLEDRFA